MVPISYEFFGDRSVASDLLVVRRTFRAEHRGLNLPQPIDVAAHATDGVVVEEGLTFTVEVGKVSVSMPTA